MATLEQSEELNEHPHAQFFRDNPTFESVEEAARREAKRKALSGVLSDAEAEWNGRRKAYAPDLVNHPPHYTSDPSGVECIQITRHRNFNVGNAIKYLFRAGLKESANQSPLDKQVEDLKKAVFYINDEIARLEAAR
ncbi:DUF3310 domain-containing protein [Rhodococcus qingshengii]